MASGARNLIFTIGYGSRFLDEFITLLKRNGIECVVDVRSSPYSRFKPEFSRDALEVALIENGIRYAYRGDSLGGRPTDSDCFEDGKVIYERVSQKEFYLRGIERLRSAHDMGIRLALMCSEGKPDECHRSKLIGTTLQDAGIQVVHLDEAGVPRTQDEIIDRITGGQLGLFGEPTFTSRKRYGDGESDD